ncbi:hypothetical protein HZF24_18110 [Sedimentibacter hydroxybenzoicus DSM 7310]|uniref:Uncharacterized protein n=1 Tax=Sedimentibacter hydroxybenzoicus DSM 7310 TaxID=1123245 RepID=A0A974BNB0_SEDHY|nr:hypothetical protein [Sedimentibacter hydroxybenzoicus]NYB76066.1 hypothetical protein [Sedimentibacter hydroxybenzoicus DSM 7310]
MLLKSKIAYLGVLLGLNQLFIILSSIIETNTIILFAGAALLVGVVIVEFGGKSGLLFYAASCLLGFFLSFNKFEFVTYVAFFGLYSYIKHLLEIKVRNKNTLFLTKMVFFNFALIIMYLVIRLFITIKLTWWMILAGQILFIIYDYAFSIFINYYITTIKPKISR